MIDHETAQRSGVDEAIVVEGARVHNLQNVSVRIPNHALTVVTGLSGSGKSSLAFDVIYAEGQRRFMEPLSSYARQFIGSMERPDVDYVGGLSPVIAIEQRTTSHSARSTVGTITEVYDFLRLLYARVSTGYSAQTGEPLVSFTQEEILERVYTDFEGEAVALCAPQVRGRKGSYEALFADLMRKGFLHVRVDGEICELSPGMQVARYGVHDIEVVVDRFTLNAGSRDRLQELLPGLLRMGGDALLVATLDGVRKQYYSRQLMCMATGESLPTPEPHTFSFNSPYGWCPECTGTGYMAVAEEGAAKDDEETERWELCSVCKGKRLRSESLCFRIGSEDIAEVCEKPIGDFASWVQGVPRAVAPNLQLMAEEIVKEIRTRVSFLCNVGLGYLSLGRSASTLSGGEMQRIRLATQIGTQLVNVLYILDEPSIGLHPRDNDKLIDSLRQLRDLGNTVLVVEHDEDMMRAADYLVDMGPGAGRHGGQVMAVGSMEQIRNSGSLTAQYLNGERSIEVPTTRRKGTGESLRIEGAVGNNLKGITVDFPLGQFICVTGVSGSGKSTLVNGTLYPILSQALYRSLQPPLGYGSVRGVELINKVIQVDQSPIGRTPRSNPATYTGLFTDIRKLFAETPEAKMRGYKMGRFSFNVKGGRCETCTGAGVETIAMSFLPDVHVPCAECNGNRYNRATLAVRYKGKTISQVLDMTVNQAAEFFSSVPTLLRKLQAIQSVGMGYIKLGQSSTTLSGGESQRIRLATELAKKDSGQTLYILDEPTTGLHFEDIRLLLGVINALVDRGNTVVVIEHNLDVMKSADHILDIGPESGEGGGELVAFGTPEQVASAGVGHTARYLKRVLPQLDLQKD